MRLITVLDGIYFELPFKNPNMFWHKISEWVSCKKWDAPWTTTDFAWGKSSINIRSCPLVMGSEISKEEQLDEPQRDSSRGLSFLPLSPNMTRAGFLQDFKLFLKNELNVKSWGCLWNRIIDRSKSKPRFKHVVCYRVISVERNQKRPLCYTSFIKAWRMRRSVTGHDILWKISNPSEYEIERKICSKKHDKRSPQCKGHQHSQNFKWAF